MAINLLASMSRPREQNKYLPKKKIKGWKPVSYTHLDVYKRQIESQELENTEKFLNQVSDYSYSLSRKNIYNENLTV